ncbi:MAG: hypothetical protein JWQ25_2737 [Daejeonella sp.]|nr:hypothetical protein [Daejeonella sp.]
MIKFYTLIFSLLSFSVSAQLNSGARLVALGNAGVAIRDVWSLTSNQAGIAEIEKLTISAGYEQRFLDKDLNAQALVIALPIRKGVLGASFQKYGISSFNEQKAGLSYAKKYGSKLNLAVNLNFHQLKILSYGNSNTFSAEVGMLYRLSKVLTIGGHIANPNRSNYHNDLNVSVPVIMQIGLSYLVSDQIIIVNTFDKTLGYSTDYKMGVEYKIIEWLSFRGGISVNPMKEFAGLGFHYQHIKFDVATSSHAVLGYTPQLALTYEF